MVAAKTEKQKEAIEVQKHDRMAQVQSSAFISLGERNQVSLKAPNVMTKLLSICPIDFRVG